MGSAFGTSSNTSRKMTSTLVCLKLVVFMSLVGPCLCICPAYFGTNLQDFKAKWWKDELNIRSWAACNSLCNDNSKCTMWTWHNKNAGKWKFYCRLMENADRVVWQVNKGVVSGVKCDACPLTMEKRPVGATGLKKYTEDSPTECAQRCNNRGQNCNYWSWSADGDDCRTMKNFTSLTTDSSYVTGFGHSCFELNSLSNKEKDFGGLDPSSVFGPSSVIIPPDAARGIYASAEYQFFRDAWAGTRQGADFVREVRNQYNAHIRRVGHIGGFRIDFTRLTFPSYSDLVTDTFNRIFGMRRAAMRGFLGRVNGITLARAGRLVDRAHRVLYRLWARMHARLMINSAITTGIVSAGTAYVGLVTSANVATVAATTTAVTAATGATSAFSILSIFSLLFLG